MPSTHHYYLIAPSPIGDLLLVADAHALRRIDFAGSWRHSDIDPSWQSGSALLDRVAAQLAEYFRAERKSFDLPLAPQGTPFQRRVWDQLQRIDYGTTTSYGELARRLGDPNAMRAVGAANGRNPIPIVIPCHRVIGSKGELTGFGGGLPLKRRLLELEQRAMPFELR